MKRLSIYSCFMLLIWLLSACSSATPAVVEATAPAPTQAAVDVTLKVFAPSSMTDAAKELAAAFEAANPGVKVTIEFGHTPTQRLQFTQGATGDVFMTASKKDMDDAITDTTVTAGQEATFARNQLVVILPPENPAGLETLEDLAGDGVTLLFATTETPIGKLTLTVLQKLDQKFGGGYQDKVLANVVSNEAGVNPIVSKVKLGEADAGIVYVSDTVAEPTLKKLDIPAELNVISQLGIAPLAKSASPEQAAAFSAFVVSAQGQAIVQKWGFLPGQP